MSVLDHQATQTVSVGEEHPDEAEIEFDKDEPYLFELPDDACLPTHVGQHVLIDWSSDNSTGSQYRPKGYPLQRKVEIVELRTPGDKLFRVRPIAAYADHPAHDPTELPVHMIYWDYRGGWTERMFDPQQQRMLCHSHPTLTFLPSPPTTGTDQ